MSEYLKNEFKKGKEERIIKLDYGKSPNTKVICEKYFY